MKQEEVNRDHTAGQGNVAGGSRGREERKEVEDVGRIAQGRKK